MQAKFADIDRGLDETAFCRSTDEKETLNVKLLEQQCKVGVVEGGVARLEKKRVVFLRLDHGDDIATFGRECGFNERPSITVPAALAVVGVDHWDVASTCVREHVGESSDSAPKRCKERIAVLVIEVADGVNDEQGDSSHTGGTTPWSGGGAEKDFRVSVDALVEFVVGVDGILEREFVRDDEGRVSPPGDDQVAQDLVVAFDGALAGSHP